MKPLKFQEYIRESANASSSQSVLSIGSNTDHSFDDLLFNNIVKTNSYTLVKENLVEEEIPQSLDKVLKQTSQILEKVKELESDSITSGPDQEDDSQENEDPIEVEAEEIEEISTIEMDPLSYKIFRDKS
jgi:hypothetical protein